MKFYQTAIATKLAFALGWAEAAAQEAPGNAQQTTVQQTTTTTTTTDLGPNGQYGDPICGAWNAGTWQDNGRCPGYAVGPHRAEVTGTIVSVKGHLVTVQQSTKQVVINDQPALANQLTGRVAVGRQIDALGYWQAGNFYATQIQ